VAFTRVLTRYGTSDSASMLLSNICSAENILD
jgi:hypothetical protein